MDRASVKPADAVVPGSSQSVWPLARRSRLCPKRRSAVSGRQGLLRGTLDPSAATAQGMGLMRTHGPSGVQPGGPSQGRLPRSPAALRGRSHARAPTSSTDSALVTAGANPGTVPGTAQKLHSSRGFPDSSPVRQTARLPCSGSGVGQPCAAEPVIPVLHRHEWKVRGQDRGLTRRPLDSAVWSGCLLPEMSPSALVPRPNLT